MTVSEIAPTTDLPPSEFEVDLGSLGPIRGRVTPATVRETEKRLGMGFLGFAQLVVARSASYTAICTVLEVMAHDVMGKATPTREELESAVLEVGLSHVLTAMQRPVSIVLLGPEG